MKRRERKLAVMGFVAAAVALAGCKSQSLGGPTIPTGGFHPTGSGGASGGGATTGGGGANLGLQGTAGLGGGGLGAGGFAAGSGSGLGGGFGAGDGSGGGGIVVLTGAAGTSGSNGCPGVGYEAIGPTPDILIVMSRADGLSALTVGQLCPSGCTKWSALEGAVNALVTQDSNNNYGFAVFGAAGACGVPEYPAIGVGPGNWSAIIDETAAVNLGGAAPVAGTIAFAVSYLQNLGDAYPKYILLATDEEATCASGDPTGTMDDLSGADAAIAGAAAEGIPTFVLGAADSANGLAAPRLNGLAFRGYLPQIGGASTYYDALSVSGVTALQEALYGWNRQPLDCTLAVPGGAPAGSTLSVTIIHDNGLRDVPFDPTGASGWAYTDATHDAITLSGEYCSEFGEVGKTDIELQYDCTPDAGVTSLQ